MRKFISAITIIMVMLATITLLSQEAMAATGDAHPGEIRCEKEGVLFTNKNYNHFHFQITEGTTAKSLVVLCCTNLDESEKSFREIFFLSDPNVVEELFDDGENLSCDAKVALSEAGAKVSYSATHEHGHDHD